MTSVEDILKKNVNYMQNGSNNGRAIHLSSDYKVDFFREVKKRWMVAGVLCAVTLAVLAPRLGAPGGALHTQYLSYVPLCYIYYSSGRRTQPRAVLASIRSNARVYALCCAHANLVAPALCAIIVTAFRDGVDYRIVKGAMLSSVCGGCVWLSLAMRGGACAGVVALAATCSCLVSLLIAPLLCGLSCIPSAASLLLSAVTAIAPFVVGMCRPTRRCDAVATKLSALSLVYMECCERLCDAAGILNVGDVLVTLLLVWCWVSCAAVSCAGYARGGALAARGARLVLACALPKASHYWVGSAKCSLAGLARLPATFLAPAQALVLAALATDEDHADQENIDAGPPNV